jgi:hypothetical protein
MFPLVIAALLIPSVALAKGPNPTSPKSHTNHGKAKVQYILHGTLSAYTPFDSTTSTNGSITITVTHSNRHGRVLKGQALTFMGMVTANTKVVLSDGVTAIADGDQGIVKIRAPKEPKNVSASDLASVLTALPVRQIIDQGAPSSG